MFGHTEQGGTQRKQEAKLDFKRPGVITVLIGLGFIILAAYNVVRWMFPAIHLDFYNALSLGSISVLLVLMATNALAVSLSRGKVQIAKTSMITVYCMVMIAGNLLFHGLVYFLPIMTIGGQMRALDQPKLWKGFMDRVSPSILPKSETALWGFFEGGSRVPWGDWLVPVIIWSMFWIVVFFILLCISSLFRKRWLEVDRLTYPLSEVPITLISGKIDGSIPIWRNRLAWVGIAISGILSVSGLLHSMFEAFPAIPTDIDLEVLFSDPAFSVLQSDYMVPLQYRFIPMLIGLAYLAPIDTSFSMWFFFLIFRIVYPLIVDSMGLFLVDHLPLFRPSMHGAVLGFGLVTIWFARRDLQFAFAQAFSSKSDEDDAGEALSSRTAVLGVMLGTVAVVLFLRFALYVPIWLGFGYMFTAYIAAITLARVRGEVPIPFNSILPYFNSYLSWGLGPDIVGENGRGLSYLQPLTAGSFSASSAYMLQSFRISEQMNIDKKRMSASIFIGVVVAIVVGWIIYLTTIYDKGFWMMAPINTNYMNEVFDQGIVGEAFGYQNTKALWHVVSNAVIVICMGAMRARFVWWPFHPVGWVFAGNDAMWHAWGPFFTAWLIKVLVMRYGGLSSSRKLLPLFYGLIIGSAVCDVFATVVSAIWVTIV